MTLKFYLSIASWVVTKNTDKFPEFWNVPNVYNVKATQINFSQC